MAARSNTSVLASLTSFQVFRKDVLLSPVRARGLVYAFLVAVLVLSATALYHCTWLGNAELHTLVEIVDTQLAFIVGVMALVRYYAKKSSMFLLLGSGFLGVAFLDGYHGLITSSFFAGCTPSTLSTLTPWSGATSRFFLSTVMCASLLFLRKRSGEIAPGRRRESAVYILVGAFTLFVFFFFAFAKLPSAYYPDLIVRRPAELLPAFIFWTCRDWIPAQGFGRS